MKYSDSCTRGRMEPHEAWNNCSVLFVNAAEVSHLHSLLYQLVTQLLS